MAMTTQTADYVECRDASTGAYAAAASSLLFLFLTSERIAQFIEGAESSRSYQARRDFRAWVGTRS